MDVRRCSPVPILPAGFEGKQQQQECAPRLPFPSSSGGGGVRGGVSLMVGRLVSPPPHPPSHPPPPPPGGGCCPAAALRPSSISMTAYKMILPTPASSPPDTTNARFSHPPSTPEKRALLTPGNMCLVADRVCPESVNGFKAGGAAQITSNNPDGSFDLVYVLSNRAEFSVDPCAVKPICNPRFGGAPACASASAPPTAAVDVCTEQSVGPSQCAIPTGDVSSAERLPLLLAAHLQTPTLSPSSPEGLLKRRQAEASNDAPGQETAGSTCKKVAKRKKKSERPKLPPSSYNLFNRAKSPALRAQHPEWGFGETSKALSALWKATTAEERAPFEAEAHALKTAWDSENPGWSQARRPKKPPTAFDFFKRARGAEMRAQHPEWKSGDVEKALQALWEAAMPDEQARFESQAVKCAQGASAAASARAAAAAKKAGRDGHALYKRMNSSELRVQHPDWSFGEVSKALATQWEAMAPAERAKIEKLARQLNKNGTNAELAMTKSAKTEAEAKHGAGKKPPPSKRKACDADSPASTAAVANGGHPKRAKKTTAAPKAYGLFRKICDGEIRLEHPEWSLGEVSKEVSVRWKALDAEERDRFEKRAKRKRAEWERERRREEMEEQSRIDSEALRVKNEALRRVEDEASRQAKEQADRLRYKLDIHWKELERLIITWQKWDQYDHFVPHAPIAHKQRASSPQQSSEGGGGSSHAPAVAQSDICQVCRLDEDDENVLICEECNVFCHTYCATPKLRRVPAGDWFCSKCAQAREAKQAAADAPLESFLALYNAAALARAFSLEASGRSSKNSSDLLSVDDGQCIDWCAVREAVNGMLNACVEREAENEEDRALPGSVFNEAARILKRANSAIENVSRKHSRECNEILMEERQRKLEAINHEACVQRDWRRAAFDPREYDKVPHYVPPEGITESEAGALAESLRSDLPDGLLGYAYSFAGEQMLQEGSSNVGTQTHTVEEQAASDHNARMPRLPEQQANAHNQQRSQTSDDVIAAHVLLTVETMLKSVEDAVRNENIDLSEPKRLLGAGSEEDGAEQETKQLREIPVWGIDCYTRRNVQLAMDRADAPKLKCAQWQRHFIEQILLPAINHQAPAKAHDMQHALAYIIAQNDTDVVMGDTECEGTSSSNLVCDAARSVLYMLEQVGQDHFRIHPKGTGVQCVAPGGIGATEFVAEYLGQLYPPWRWYERVDLVESTQKQYGMQPGLPDFYNIVLERHHEDSRGYLQLYVDASQRANFASSLSHSCDPNCMTQMCVRNGRFSIAVITIRPVAFGEELTMDYGAITENENEFKSAVCLCGKLTCRSSYLQFVGYNFYARILRREHSRLHRLALLVRACISITSAGATSPLTTNESELLVRHGLKAAALGGTPVWLQRFASLALEYVDRERDVMPRELMRFNAEELASLKAKSSDSDGALGADDASKLAYVQEYSRSNAELEARQITEQRVQCLTVACDRARIVLGKQDSAATTEKQGGTPPLRILSDSEVAGALWCNPDSVARRLFALVKSDDDGSLKRHFSAADDDEEEGEEDDAADTAADAGTTSPEVERIRALLDEQEVKTAAEASSALMAFRAELLRLKPNALARHDAAADLVLLIAKTRVFISASGYREVVSEPMVIQARELGGPVRRLGAAGGSENDDTKVKRPRSAYQFFCAKCRTGIVSRMPSGASASAIHKSLGKAWQSASSDVKARFTAEAEADKARYEQELRERRQAPPSPKFRPRRPKTKQARLKQEEEERKRIAERERLEAERRAAEFFEPEEEVFCGSKSYGPFFILNQLLGWCDQSASDFDFAEPAGGSHPGRGEEAPLRGCGVLPDVTLCYGPSASLASSPTTQRGQAEAAGSWASIHREALLDHLEHEMHRNEPWPAEVLSSFSSEEGREDVPSCVLFGSPMLDTMLGWTDGLDAVVDELARHTSEESQTARRKNERKGNFGAGADSATAAAAADGDLAKGARCNWVQCENSTCMKWRKLPFYADISSLPEQFSCEMNIWVPEQASCDVPEDQWDDGVDQSLEQDWAVGAETMEIKVGEWVDCYCIANDVWYEARIADVTDKIRVHFHGWPSKFDEWLPKGTNRLMPHHTKTKVTAWWIKFTERQESSSSGSDDEVGETGGEKNVHGSRRPSPSKRCRTSTANEEGRSGGVGGTGETGKRKSSAPQSRRQVRSRK